MNLALDARQRAMLLEMGVRVWQPVTALEPETAIPAVPALASIPGKMAAEAAPDAPLSESPLTQNSMSASLDASVRSPVRPPSPTRLTELPEGIANMDWPGLAGAVQHCQACAMCLGRRTPVLAPPQAATACDWLVLGDPPDEP